MANIVKFVTGLRGRSYRGRVYLPFVDESTQAQGHIVAGKITDGQGAWEAFHTDMSTDGFELVVASYLHSTAEDVIAVLFERDTATQRRRNKRASS